MAENDSASIGKANTLLCLQFLSDFGDQITSALLALCLLDITQSTGQVGLVYFITTLGYVFFTLIGGLLGDKISRRNILFFSDLGRALVVLLLILALNEKSILLSDFIFVICFRVNSKTSSSDYLGREHPNNLFGALQQLL